MPIALALPFAEAAGIAVAGLSAAAIANKVSEYIKLNPEDSMMILKMINPASGGAFAGEGISTLFKKKAKTEKEPSIEDLEEIGEDLSQSDKAKVMKAYGKSKSADKRQRMIDIAKKLGLAGEEKERQKSFDEVEGRYEDSDFEEERTKPKFDYTKFFKADGGRVGYAKGGRGYSDYASPSSTTASQDFATQAVSGGQTDYSGGGGGNDQPITEIRPNFNYNIDPFSINPRLNFKNIASIIYLQEFLDKKARGEDPNLEADINFRDQLGNLGIFGNLGRSGNIVGANIPFLQSGLASLAYNTDTGLAAGLRGNLTEDLSGGVSFQDGQQNLNLNYNKGPFSAGFTFGPEENNIQVGFKMPFADGGRVNYQAGGVATPEQYAAALQKVGAGTETQKRTSLGNYLGDYIATQGQKLGNAAVIPFQAAKGVLGIQGTPITDSMQTSLQNIIQNQIKNSGKLSGNINYNDYGVKTNTQGNEFLGFGDRSFTDPEAALATTLGQASYSVDPKTGKITFTGGTAYDFGDNQFGGLGKFISKGGVFNQLPSVSNKFQPGATEYNPDITLGSDFMKQFNQPKYPDYKTAALQSQYYKNNPSNLDSDLFRAAYARALPDSGIKTRITNEGQVATDYGNYDPSRVYSAYMGNTGTSSSNPFFDQFKGSQYADMPTIMEAMYGTPGNMNPYYADGGLATMFRRKQ
jgi:hypothetical protein